MNGRADPATFTTMHQSGGDPLRHWHHWTPLDKDTRTDKRCACGAVRSWNGKRWVVKKRRVRPANGAQSVQ